MTDDTSHLITSLPPPASEEQQLRIRQYLLSMAVRTVCFIAAIFTQGYYRWTLMIAAVILPYFAVVVANTKRNFITQKFSAHKPISNTLMTSRQQSGEKNHLNNEE